MTFKAGLTAILVLGLPLAGLATQQVTDTEADSMQVRGNGFSIPRYTIDGGGTISAHGGGWRLAGTIGQYDATEPQALGTGNWQLTGGFWSVAAELPETGDDIFADRFEPLLP